MGRISTPGCSRSMMKYVKPLCLGWSKSLRATNMPRVECNAPDVHTFWPLITHSSPSRSALHETLARSEPAPGSLKSWHQPSVPLAKFGSQRCFCSSVPKVMVTGAPIRTPKPEGAPMTPRSAKARAIWFCSLCVHSRPNHADGQRGNDSCASFINCHHWRSVKESFQFSSIQSRVN